MNKVDGFTLLEVLLAIMLSLFVCALLFKIIINADSAWRRQQDQVTTIEKALTTKTILQNAITHAGYLGCQSAYGNVTVVDHLHAYKDVHPWLQVTPDTLDVMYLSPEATQVLELPGADEVLVGESFSIKAGDVVVISDCRHAEIVKASSVRTANQKTKIVFEQSLSYEYEGFVTIGKLIVNQFYLKNTSRRDERGNRIKSLYVRNTSGRNQETVLGINALSFLKSNNNIDVNLTFSQGDHYNFSVVCENC
jgi:hypothetical protein